MLRLTVFLLLIWGSIYNAAAQMPVRSDTLYGNEWITYGQPYYKIQIANNGIYRIPSTLLPINSVSANRYQIYHNGKRIPVYTTTQGIPTANDYIEFYGQKNTNEIDSFMYKYGSISQLNPDYSIIGDTSAYFLTWSNAVNPEAYTPTPNTLTNLPPKETYFMYDWRNEYHNSYLKPEIGSGVYLSEYGKGEGYGLDWAVNRTLNLTPPACYLGQNATLSFRVLKDAGNHYTKIDINGNTVRRDTTGNYHNQIYTFAIPSLGNTLRLEVGGSYADSGDPYDRHTIGQLQLRYARQFDFENKKFFEFTLPVSSTVRYVEIDNFNHGGVAPLLYDVAHKIRIETTLLNGKVAIALPPAAMEQNLILVNAVQGISSIQNVHPVVFEDLHAAQNNNALNDYIIISNKNLYDDGNQHNYVQDYADYRASNAGGGYRTKIIEIQQLYEQFSYGMNRHPIAIRNFAHFIKKNWNQPKYLFIIGKGRESQTIRADGSLNTPSKKSFGIPTWGTPGSDNLLVSTNKSNVPVIPIGRLAVSTPQEISIYLTKVKQLENNQQNAPQTLEARAWMKNAIHLSGGGSIAATIKNYMNQLRDSLQSGDLQMNVTSFYVNSTDPVQTSQTLQIFDKINEGASLVTFFGHSGTNILDFDINSPSRFRNVGKYPFFVALGCDAGNVHTDSRSLAEDFVLYENKANIGFVAVSGHGYDGSLYNYTQAYYRLVRSGNALGLGDYIQLVNRTLDPVYGDDVRSVLQQFTLHADPAVRLHRMTAPDYVPDATSVRFQPSVLTTRLDSFDMSLNLVNLGTHQRDSIGVLIEQQLPTGVVKLLLKTKVMPAARQQNYTFRLPMLKEALGKNQILVKLDPDNLVAEMPLGAENNNDLQTNNARGITVYIRDNSTQIIYPQPFAIINEIPVVLRASTSNAITKSRRYFMELDTTAFFNSTFKKTTEINSIGGILKWQPDVVWQPNRSYYWRVSPDSVDAYGYTWQNASFIYLPQSSTGWNQSHYFQYLNNAYTTLGLKDYNRNFQYANDTRSLRLINKASDAYNSSVFFIQGRYSGRTFMYGEVPIAQPLVNVYVIDSIDMSRWVNDDPRYNFGLKHGTYVNNFGLFMFNTERTDSLYGRPALMKFLNFIPNGNYVILHTIQPDSNASYYPERWAADSLVGNRENLFQLLENQGARLIRNTIARPLPYIFAYQKGKGVIVEKLAAHIEETLDETFVITGRWFEGKMLSERIGPAQSWDSLAFYNSNLQATDFNYFNVYGIRNDGITKQLLDSNVVRGQSLTHINATEYPYLQLQWYSKDSVLRTTSQLDYWRIFYTGMPDLSLNAGRHYKISADSIERGDKVQIQIAVENAGNYNITDSVLFKYVHTDEQNRASTQFLKLKPLAKGASTIADFTIDSKSLTNHIKVNMEVNVEQRPKELLYSNNLGEAQFYVAQDRKNPLLEVTFDGQRILNNDIVSPQPAIMIALRDENRFLALSDTNLFRLYLKKPGLNEPEKQLFFNLNSELRFIPAGSDLTKNNRAMVEYRPRFEKDGVYTLRIEAKDATDNQAGTSDYQVGFKVITKSSLSNVLNYPNPFSTSTQFVYTLTGTEIPEFFKIQIMSVSGKIVREITQQELGDLKIGTHRTDFRWNGTDEFGDKLANGVYLYRIIAKKRNGSTYEIYDTGADNDINDSFKGGFGKLVIVR